MLYYLDILPVPDHLRAYLQNEETSALNYAVNANPEKCAETIKNGGADIQNGKGLPPAVFEIGHFGSAPSGFESGVLGSACEMPPNTQPKENGTLKKPSQIPRLVRSKSSPQGFDGFNSNASQTNEVCGTLSRPGSRIPNMKRNRRNNFGFANTLPPKSPSGGRPSSTSSKDVSSSSKDMYLHQRSLSSCSGLKLKGKENSFVSDSSKTNSVPSAPSVNSNGKEAYSHTRSLSNCSANLLSRAKIPLDDGPRILTNERGRRSRRSTAPANGERMRTRSASSGRSRHTDGTEARNVVASNPSSYDPFSNRSRNDAYGSYDSSNSNCFNEYEVIVQHLQHESSAVKRDGLLSLQSYLNSMRPLTTTEARVTRDMFNRYLSEVNSKLYSLFLDVLSEFIVQYKHELQDWLYILLTRLLHRISSEALPSAQTKIALVLDVVRDSYPYEHQFQIITKYITDNTASPSIKMKVRLLQYFTGLIPLMDANDFNNSALIRLAVSRIVTWMSEPKSPEVRKEASAVIIALFQLNSAKFSMLLSNVPASIQEGATRVIQARLKNSGCENPMANFPISNGSTIENAPKNLPPKSPSRKASSSANQNYRKAPVPDYEPALHNMPTNSSSRNASSDNPSYRKPPVPGYDSAPNTIPANSHLRTASSDNESYRKPPPPYENHCNEAPVTQSVAFLIKQYNGDRRNNCIDGNAFSPPNNLPNGNTHARDVDDDVRDTDDSSRLTYAPIAYRFIHPPLNLAPNNVYGPPQIETLPPPLPPRLPYTSAPRQWPAIDSTPLHYPKQYEDSLMSGEFSARPPVCRATPPVNNRATPPVNNRATPPVNGMIPPVEMATPPVNGMIPPVDKATLPVNGMILPVNGMIPPVDRATPTVNRTVPLGMPPPVSGPAPLVNNRAAPHVNGATPPINRMTQPISRTSPPVNRSSPPVNRSSPPVNRIGDGAEHPDAVVTCGENKEQPLNLFNQISTILRNHKLSKDSEDVKNALQELNKLIRSWDNQVVSSMLKDIVPDIIALLRHNEAAIRCLATRSLREIARSHPDAYRNNINSFIVPLLQTQSDNQTEVARIAEECCTIVSQTLSPDELIPCVSSLVGDLAYPVNLSAMKMLSSVCERNCEKKTLNKHIEVIVRNLLKSYDHSESSARKAAVFCLVSLHNLAGADAVTPYFSDLEGSKSKLLHLYIRRSLSTNV